jgi:hypothetical protein
MPNPNQFEVQITTDHNTIVCNVKDGNVRGGNVLASNKGDRIHFVGVGGTQFALAFQEFPSGNPVWPFVEAKPSSWPVPEFTGTLRQLVPPPPPAKYYKYTIGVAGLPSLDPIIIVDD